MTAGSRNHGRRGGALRRLPVPGAYARLLSRPDVAGLAVAGLLARLPQGMFSIAVLLTFSARFPVSAAGVATACYAVASTLAGPRRARHVERTRSTRALYTMTGAAALGAGLLVLAVYACRAAWPAWAAAGFIGFTVPPLSATVRGLWGELTDGQDTARAAFALDSLLVDLGFIVGPSAAAAVVSWAGPPSALAVWLALTVAASVLVARLTAGRPPGAGPAERQWRLVAGSRALGSLIIATVFATSALAVIDIAVVAATPGRPWAAGALFTEMAAASVAGGLWWGTRHPAEPAARSLPAWLTWLAAASALLLAAGGNAAVLAGLLPLAGLAVGPVFAAISATAAQVSPPGAFAETQAWVGAGNMAGVAVGGFIGAAAVSGGTAAGFIAAAGSAVVAVCFSLVAARAVSPADT